MWRAPENDQFYAELWVAGERVPAGRYRQVGGQQTVTLEQEGILPAAPGKPTACYLAVTAYHARGGDRLHPPVQ